MGCFLDIEAAFDKQLHLAAVTLPDRCIDALMREGGHGKAGMDDADLPGLIGHNLICSFDAQRSVVSPEASFLASSTPRCRMS